MPDIALSMTPEQPSGVFPIAAGGRQCPHPILWMRTLRLREVKGLRTASDCELHALCTRPCHPGLESHQRGICPDKHPLTQHVPEQLGKRTQGTSLQPGQLWAASLRTKRHRQGPGSPGQGGLGQRRAPRGRGGPVDSEPLRSSPADTLSQGLCSLRAESIFKSKDSRVSRRLWWRRPGFQGA